jgi:deoxyribose-phosphate aldolase
MKSGHTTYVRDEVKAICETAHSAGAIVKVIFENAYLTQAEKVTACHLCEEAGADFVKTSTGFAPTGANIEDIKLMRENVKPSIQVKAAHGVRTLDAVLQMIDAGATRIGATATATILDDFARKSGDLIPLK